MISPIDPSFFSCFELLQTAPHLESISLPLLPQDSMPSNSGTSTLTECDSESALVQSRFISLIADIVHVVLDQWDQLHLSEHEAELLAAEYLQESLPILMRTSVDKRVQTRIREARTMYELHQAVLELRQVAASLLALA